jgi:hypothetical protein
MHAPLSPLDLPVHERNGATARAQVDGASWEAAWSEGNAITLEEAIEYALSAVEPVAPVPSVPEQQSDGSQLPNLTRREKDVGTLVARELKLL